MPPRRQPASLYSSAKTVLTDDIRFRVRVMLQNGLPMNHTLDYIDQVISSLPPGSSTDIARKALRCADFLGERFPLSPSLLALLVRVLIHDSTTAFPITALDSYQVRQAVLYRLCDLWHLQVYYNLQYFHENFNIFSTLQRLQSLPNLRQVFLSQWCSDEIARLLSKSCPNLTLLDAQNSLSLTDSSVPSLIQCQRLKVLLIHSTSISEAAYQTLLENLPLLRKIGPCNRLKSIVSKITQSTGSYLSLREYESCEVPDDEVLSKCPQLASLHLYGTQPWQEGPIPTLFHQVTHLKLQATSGNYLNQLLTSSILHLDLQEYHELITEANVTTIANVCTQLRVLRLNQLSNQCRLAPGNKEAFPFSHLEELEIPDSALALDIIKVSPRMRHISIRTPRSSSPFSLRSVSTHWTDAALQNITEKKSLQCLESFVLSTRCKFSVKTILNFILGCAELRALGNVHTWSRGQSWEESVLYIESYLEKNNLDVQIIH